MIQLAHLDNCPGNFTGKSHDLTKLKQTIIVSYRPKTTVDQEVSG